MYSIRAIREFEYNGSSYLVYAGCEFIFSQNIKTGERVEKYDVGDIVSLTISEMAGNPIVLGGCMDGAVKFWNLFTLKEIDKPFQAHHEYVKGLSVFKSEDIILVASGGSRETGEGEIRVWDLESKIDIIPPNVGRFEGSVQSIAANRINGTTILAVAGDNVYGRYKNTNIVYVINALTGSDIWIPEMVRRGLATSVALGKLDDQTVMLVGDGNAKITVWSVTKKSLLFESTGMANPWVTAVAIGNFEKASFFAAAWGESVRIWNLDDFTPITDLVEAHDDQVTSISFCKIFDRPSLITASLDGTIRVWDLDKHSMLDKINSAPPEKFRSVAVTVLDGMPVAVCAGIKGIYVLNANDGKPVGRILNEVSNVSSLAIGRINGNTSIIAGSWNSNYGAIGAWDICKGRYLGNPVETNDNSRICSISSRYIGANSVLFIARAEGGITVWDSSSSNKTYPQLQSRDYLDKSMEAVDSIVWRGRMYAIGGGGDRQLSIWDVESGKKCFNCRHKDYIRAVKVKEIGNRIFVISGGDESMVSLWEVVDRRSLNDIVYGDEKSPSLDLICQMFGHIRWVFAVAILEYDRDLIILSGGKDRILRVWNDTGNLLMEISLDSEIHAIEPIPNTRKCIIATNHGLLAINILPDS